MLHPAPYHRRSHVPLPAGSGLPAWVAALALWQWYEIPNTALSDTAPNPVPPGFTGPQSKIIDWTGATLRKSGSVYMIGAAGGHLDYAGNEVDSLLLNTPTPTWEQISPPSPNEVIISGQDIGQYGLPFYADGTASPTHTYYATQYVDSIDRLFIMPSPGYSGSNNPTPAGWAYIGAKWVNSFNYATKTWDLFGSYVPQFPDGGDFVGALAVKHPVTEDIYYCRSIQYCPLWRWTAATNTWVEVTSSMPRYAWYAAAAIDPTRSYIFTVGARDSEVSPYVFDLSGVQQSVTFGGLGVTALQITGEPGMVYEPNLDAYLILANNQVDGVSTYMLKVDAATWNVSSVTVTGSPPLFRTNGIHNAIQYVPELRGVVIADSYTGNVKFMRTAA